MEQDSSPDGVFNIDDKTAPITTGNTKGTARPNPKKQPTTRRKKIVIGLALALLAIGGAVTTFVILNNNKSSNISNSQPTETEEINPHEKLRLSGNQLSDFDLAFLGLEDSQSKNLIYSPLSIKYALAMLKDGTSGESQAQIENLIGDYQPKSYLNSANRSLANALFVRDSFKDTLVSTYPETLKTKYNAELILDSFASPTTINSWVKDKTLGLVDSLVNDVSDIDLVLANALAIDMNWNNQLQCKRSDIVPCKPYEVRYAHEKDANVNGPYPYYHLVKNLLMTEDFDRITFNNQPDGAVAADIGTSVNRYDIIKEVGESTIRETVSAAFDEWMAEHPEGATRYTDKEAYLNEYMSELTANYNRIDNSTDFYFADNDIEKVFAKDLKEYDGSTLQYVAVMPKNENLASYLSHLDAETANEILGNLKDASKIENYKDNVVTKIVGHIPFFKFDYELNLREDLEKLGVTDVFDSEKADLSGVMSTSGESISKAVHKANIEFTNDGIRAAAATGIAGNGAAGGGFEYLWDVPVEEIDITFDQPYLFLIRDKSTGEVWFTGTVYEPTK